MEFLNTGWSMLQKATLWSSRNRRNSGVSQEAWRTSRASGYSANKREEPGQVVPVLGRVEVRPGKLDEDGGQALPEPQGIDAGPEVVDVLLPEGVPLVGEDLMRA